MSRNLHLSASCGLPSAAAASYPLQSLWLCMHGRCGLPWSRMLVISGSEGARPNPREFQSDKMGILRVEAADLINIPSIQNFNTEHLHIISKWVAIKSPRLQPRTAQMFCVSTLKVRGPRDHDWGTCHPGKFESSMPTKRAAAEASSPC